MSTNESRRPAATGAAVLDLIKSTERVNIPDEMTEGIWQPSDAFIVFDIAYSPPVPVPVHWFVNSGC